MELFEALHTRRSIRRFLEREVERSKLVDIIEAGRAAPSAGNLQSYKFIVIERPELKAALAKACDEQWWLATAPVLILVCSEPVPQVRHYGERGRLYATQGAAAVIQNMLLAAHGLGLASCWVASFDPDALRTITGIPEAVQPEAVLPVGYPDECPEIPSKKPLAAQVFFASWGNRFEELAKLTGYWSESWLRRAAEAKAELEAEAAKAKKLGEATVRRFGAAVQKLAKRLIEGARKKLS